MPVEQEEIEIDEDLIKSLNNGMLMSSMILSDNVYMDLSLAKDYYIGTLLTFITHPDPKHPISNASLAYDYIINNLLVYRGRVFNDISYYFPRLGITNDDIRKRLYDPVFSNLIFKHSPITDFIKLMTAQISVNVNNSAVVSKKDDITFTVNTYPLVLNQTNIDVVGNYISMGYGVTAKVIYVDPTKMDVKFLTSFDEIYTYYFKEMLTIKAISKAFSEFHFMAKKLFIPEFLGETVSTVRDPSKELKAIKAWMDNLTTVKYIKLAFVTASLPKQDVEDSLQTE